MQVGQLQLRVSSFLFERAMRDLVVLQCLDAALHGGMLVNHKAADLVHKYLQG